MNTTRFEELASVYRRALLDDVVPFWMRHSVDPQQGGFFTLLDRDGTRYGDDKPVWLQGRQVWLLSTLFSSVQQRSEWLDAAQRGADFLTRHCFAPSGKMYFLVTREGRPLRMRRYVFSEVFGTLAYAALSHATGSDAARRRALEIYERFKTHLRTPGLIEPKTNPAVRPGKGLSPLMCLLNMSETLLRLKIGDAAALERCIDECAEEILRDFVRPEDACVLESVAPDGSRIDAPEGRVMNPGHAIECAWFILEAAQRRGDAQLARRALPMIDWSLERGWDREHGGLLYFVDVHGKPATQLEHDMKLWWPHNEALVATLLAFSMTREPRYWRAFEQLHEWSFAHFADPQFGEWYGYLRRDGSVSTPIKGGHWKGAFHVPRCLLYCWRLLESLARPE